LKDRCSSSVTPSSFSDLEIGTLWPATSTDDTVLVRRDFCVVESTIADMQTRRDEEYLQVIDVFN